ncbi:MAG: 7-carboxy-7-deazaguanine synthase QueE, partial [Gloeobacteraceae cyanobacterium ES-bin-316]|nr:7-carboxy-7-deazaguanine synthase QueE [Ferruginibacter sp.]
GEGYHQGKAAYFVRLAGCDVGCVWCDVKDSWDATKHPLFTTDEIVKMAVLGSQENQEKVIAVVTGGEPLMHNLDLFTTALKASGFQTNIETSGAHPLSGYWDWICLSPKKFKAPLPEVIRVADELKVVIFHKSDFEWAEQFASQVSPKCKLYLQPEWDKAGTMTPLIIEYIMQHPQWRISLQIHKYLNVP